jgi:hypothetical protein
MPRSGSMPSSTYCAIGWTPRSDPLAGPVERRARGHAHRGLLEEIPHPAPRAWFGLRALGLLRCRFVREHDLEQAADGVVHVQYFFDFRHVVRRREGSEPAEVLLGLQDRPVDLLDWPALGVDTDMGRW